MRFPVKGVHENVYIDGRGSAIIGSVNLDEPHGNWYGRLTDGRRSPSETVSSKQEAEAWVRREAAGLTGVN